jgi:hypothetical protein
MLITFLILLSLSAKDGQTKDRVEVWRKNLHGLTEEIMKQAKMLEEVGEGGAGKTAEGGSELKVDYFDHIVNTVSKEIHELMVICRHVLTLPLQHQSKQKMESKAQSLPCIGIDSQWKILQDQMKNEVTKVLHYAQAPSKLRTD